jgi:N-acetyl-anhydromuramyl-L-alanine amidase AmpD
MTTVINRPSSHHSDRQGQTIRYLIVHSTASPVGSTAEGTLNYLVGPNEPEVSAHEVVLPDDMAYITVPDELAAHHCESRTTSFPDGTSWWLANEITWGVEAFQVVGKSVGAEVRATTLGRVVEACKRLKLGASQVLGHREIDPTNRSDPVGVDVDEFRAEVAQRLLADALLAEAEAHLLLPLNPAAALQKRIFADGLVPNSTEFDLEHGAVSYVAQRAEDLKTGAVRVYYVKKEDWDEVNFVERPLPA